MAPFEFCECGQAGFGMNPLPEGTVSLSKRGKVRAHVQDLALVGLEHYAAIVADVDGMRIGLRAPRPEERRASVAICAVQTKAGHDTGRREFSVMPALRRLHLAPEACVGRYTLKTKDDLVYFCLTEAREPNTPAETPASGATKT